MRVTEAELAELLNSGAWIVSEFNSGPPPTPQQQATRTAAQAQAQAQLPEPYEPVMQARVIEWAEAQSHPALQWLFHTPNGEYRTKATLGRLSKMGINSGVPDLLLPWRMADFVGLAIEMKRRPNKPSAEQLQWLAHLEAQGWRCEVCYSAQAAIDVLREYLDIT
jgi:hypothetical protein